MSPGKSTRPHTSRDERLKRSSAQGPTALPELKIEQITSSLALLHKVAGKRIHYMLTPGVILLYPESKEVISTVSIPL